MTSLSQDVLDAMREWLRSNGVTAGWYPAPSDRAVAGSIDRYYRGGVSAFISKHGGEA